MSHLLRKRPRGLRSQTGLATVEFALIAVALIVMVCGLIDVGRAIYAKQVLLNLSREAANLSARGTSLQEAATLEVSYADPLNMASAGRIVVSTVTRDGAGNPFITQQCWDGGLTAAQAPSQLGNLAVCSPAPLAPPPSNPAASPANAAGVPSTLPPTGKTLYVAEVYYQFQPATPIGALLPFPGLLSDVAYF